MVPRRVSFSALSVACVVLGAVLLPACGGESGDGEQVSAGNNLPEARDVYPGVRGEVIALPSDGRPPQDLKIRHEHVPGFKNASGSVHQQTVTVDGVERVVPGMRAMQMSFETGPGVDPDDLAIGDRISFDMHVAWNERGVARIWITNVRDLPDGAEISWDDKVSHDTEGETPLGATGDAGAS